MVPLYILGVYPFSLFVLLCCSTWAMIKLLDKIAGPELIDFAHSPWPWLVSFFILSGWGYVAICMDRARKWVNVERNILIDLQAITSPVRSECAKYPLEWFDLRYSCVANNANKCEDLPCWPVSKRCFNLKTNQFSCPSFEADENCQQIRHVRAFNAI